MNRLIRAGSLTAVVDALFATVLTMIYGRSVVALWQGVAAVPFGKSMIGGGARTVLIGLAMHVVVAFSWSAILLLLLTSFAWLRRLLDSPNGYMKIAAVYGPMIWVIMSCVMIPLFTHTTPTITWRWWVQLAGHIFFVAMPMAWAYSRTAERPDS